MNTIRVWISSYNNADALKLCVNSWLKYSDFPITIFDDFSTADVRRAALSYASNRVKVMGNEKREGHPACMIKASKEKEDFILYSDVDVEILEPINAEMFPKDCDMAGLYMPPLSEPTMDGITLTVPRLHACFLLVRRTLVPPVHEMINGFAPFILPLEKFSIFYDTAALLFNLQFNLGGKVQPISPDLARRIVHYGGLSRIDEFKENAKGETAAKAAEIMEANADLVKKRAAGDCGVLTPTAPQPVQFWDIVFTQPKI